jgi:hypothetical protein
MEASSPKLSNGKKWWCMPENDMRRDLNDESTSDNNARAERSDLGLWRAASGLLDIGEATRRHCQEPFRGC